MPDYFRGNKVNSSISEEKTVTRMLNYFKTILSSVSFDAMLFEKELRKALRTLIAEDIAVLRKWCYEQFSDDHEVILNRCFA